MQDVFVGVDIDLVRDFADTLDRPVEFVGLSWPSVLSDVTMGEFDMVVGGIHVTPLRQAAAAFSQPYLRVPRRAITRCGGRRTLCIDG